MHSQKIIYDNEPQIQFCDQFNNIDQMLEEYEKCNTYTDRKNFLDRIQQNLITAVTSELEFDKVLSIIKDPELQKRFVIALNDLCCKCNQPICITETRLIKIFTDNIHPDYQPEFAQYALGRESIKKFLAQDSTSDRFKLIIGINNQIENLKKVLSFDDFKKIYYSPFKFRDCLAKIQQSERINFIKDFVGINNFVTLKYPLLTLSATLEVLPPNLRYSFLTNDLGINNFKAIMYGDDTCSYHHEMICKLLTNENINSLCETLFTEEQQAARSKLEAYRDAIENTDFITTAGKYSNSLHGCVEIETRNGSKKLVSATAKYILDTIEENRYILSNHIGTVSKVQNICKKALGYDKIRPEYKEGFLGTALQFTIWMTRTNEAMELYTRIAEDKIANIQTGSNHVSKLL